MDVIFGGRNHKVTLLYWNLLNPPLKVSSHALLLSISCAINFSISNHNVFVGTLCLILFERIWTKVVKISEIIHNTLVL